MSLPTFFIVGAQKSGTTTLYSHLSGVEGVYMSPIKEPNHFCTDLNEHLAEKFNKGMLFDRKKYFSTQPLKQFHMAYITDWKDYQKLFFAGKDARVRGEASTNYLYSTVAAKNIKKRVPDAKIVIIVRDPVKRAFSHYLMDLGDGDKLPPFDEAIHLENNWLRDDHHHKNRFVDFGMYYEQVKRYTDAFGKENVLVLLLDDLKDEPDKTMRRLLSFIGLPKARFSLDTERTNIRAVPKSGLTQFLMRQKRLRAFLVGLMPRRFKRWLIGILFSAKPKQGMSDAAREELRELFAPDVKKLERLIGRKTGW